MLKLLSSDKHSSLLGTFISYEENEVRPRVLIHKTSQEWFFPNIFVNIFIFKIGIQKPFLKRNIWSENLRKKFLQNFILINFKSLCKNIFKKSSEYTP
jgi:hypothetical protein